MPKKTWSEKFQTPPPETQVLDKPYAGQPAGAVMLISSPTEIQEYIENIPRGATKTPVELRDDLAKKHKADFTCPLTTGIFLRIIAEKSLEEGPPLVPFWRIVEPKSPLAKKLSCGPDFIVAQRAAEA